MLDVARTIDHSIYSNMFKNTNVLMSLSSQLLKQPPPFIPAHQTHYDSGYSIYSSFSSSCYSGGYYGNGSYSSYVYNSYYHNDFQRKYPVQAVTQLKEHSSTEIIDVSRLEQKSSAVVEYADIADVDGKLYCVDDDVSTSCWLKIIEIAKDCQSYNVVLKSTSNGVVLETMRNIRSGEPLLMWFNDSVLAMLEMPYLSDLNFEDKRYVCHICRKSFDDPNPLKLHLALKCNRLDDNHLWTLLAQEIRAVPQITVDLLDKVPFSFELTPTPMSKPKPLELENEKPSKIRKLDDKLENSLTYVNSLQPLFNHAMPPPPPPPPVMQAISPPSMIKVTSSSTMVASPPSMTQVSSPLSFSQTMSPPSSLQASSPPSYSQATSVSSYGQISLVPYSQISSPPSYQISPPPSYQMSSPPSYQMLSPPSYQPSSPSSYGQVTSPSSLSQATTPDTSFSPTSPRLTNLSLHSTSTSTSTSSSSSSASSTNISPVKRILGHRNSAFKPYPMKKPPNAVSRELALLRSPYDVSAAMTDARAAQIETIASNLGKSKDGHQCLYCGKRYSRKYGLKVHIRIHTGYKPLRCKICDRPFGDPSNLNKHIRLHAKGDTPYKCQLCGKVLVRRRDLERHMRSRHGDTMDLVSDDQDSNDEMDVDDDYDEEQL